MAKIKKIKELENCTFNLEIYSHDTLKKITNDILHHLIYSIHLDALLETERHLNELYEKSEDSSNNERKEYKQAFEEQFEDFRDDVCIFLDAVDLLLHIDNRIFKNDSTLFDYYNKIKDFKKKWEHLGTFMFVK
jgi:hypothetical protein